MADSSKGDSLVSINSKNDSKSESNLFTYQPEINEKSKLIAYQLPAFDERQQRHIDKQQLQLLEAMKLYNPGDKNRIRTACASTPKTARLILEGSKSSRQSPTNDNALQSAIKSSSDSSQSQRKVGIIKSGGQTCRAPPTTTSLESATLVRSRTDIKAKPERARRVKQLTEQALRNKKVFLVIGGYKPVRKGLRKRNFVEKLYKPTPMNAAIKRIRRGTRNQQLNDDSDDDDDVIDGDEEFQYSDDSLEETDSMKDEVQRIVRNVTPTFVWTTKVSTDITKNIKKEAILNHYMLSGCFTTKNGLTLSLRDIPWVDQINPDEFYPRCHRIGCEDERVAFIEDFRITACASVLKIALLQIEEEELFSDSEENSQCTLQELRQSTANKRRRKPIAVIPETVLRYALMAITHYVKEQSFEYIDESPSDATVRKADYTDEKWDAFVEKYYLLAHEGALLENPRLFVNECKEGIESLRPFFPTIDTDGVKNIWICKPGAKSRGRGIQCLRYMTDILALVGNGISLGRRESRYVAQKYIERPFLIYNTKFDIRQWFLVTDWNPLTVWFYKTCYIRLCSRQYSLIDLDIGVHLSNVCVQSKIENEKLRPKELPDDNMFTSEQLADYLRKQGHGDAYVERIYPTMRSHIVRTMQCCQNSVDHRKMSFELYGADFMIGADLRVFLIEINSSPAMGPTSELTKKLCANVMEDTLKVVIDRKYDRNADVGNFELALRQPLVAAPPYIGANLIVEGTVIRKPNWFNTLGFNNSMVHTLERTRASQLQSQPSILEENTSLNKGTSPAESINKNSSSKIVLSLSSNQPSNQNSKVPEPVVSQVNPSPSMGSSSSPKPSRSISIPELRPSSNLVRPTLATKRKIVSKSTEQAMNRAPTWSELNRPKYRSVVYTDVNQSDGSASNQSASVVVRKLQPGEETSLRTTQLPGVDQTAILSTLLNRRSTSDTINRTKPFVSYTRRKDSCRMELPALVSHRVPPFSNLLLSDSKRL